MTPRPPGFSAMESQFEEDRTDCQIILIIGCFYLEPDLQFRNICNSQCFQLLIGDGSGAVHLHPRELCPLWFPFRKKRLPSLLKLLVPQSADRPCCRMPTIPVPMQVSFQPILFSYIPLSVRPVLIREPCVSLAFRSLFYYLTVPRGTGKYGRHVIFLNFCVQNFLRCQSAPSDF